MGATATTVPIFSADDWAARLIRLYPDRWTSDAAKVAGGILFTLFSSTSTQFNFLQNGLEYLLNNVRLATATGDALDAFANDYFGDLTQFEAVVVRQVGEPDDAFRQRIYDNLLQSGGTRADVIRVVQLLTDATPRVIEPWNLMDCSACDSITFCDIDTPENPGRTMNIDLGFRFQALVESILPSYGGQGNNPVYTPDNGFSCDRSFIIDPQPTWFIGEDQLDQAINRVRMFSTIIWRSYGSTLAVNYARGGNTLPGVDTGTLQIEVSPPCENALIVLANPNWNSTVGVTVNDLGTFTLEFGNAAPGDASVDYIAAPATLLGYGILQLEKGVTSANLAVPVPGQVLIASPSWQTDFFQTQAQTTSAAFEFSNPAPAGGVIYYGSFEPPNGGQQSVNAGDLSAFVEYGFLTEGSYQLVILPGWNTSYSVVKNVDSFTVTFSNEPPENSFFSWGLLNQIF